MFAELRNSRCNRRSSCWKAVAAGTRRTPRIRIPPPAVTPTQTAPCTTRNSEPTCRRPRDASPRRVAPLVVERSETKRPRKEEDGDRVHDLPPMKRATGRVTTCDKHRSPPRYSCKSLTILYRAPRCARIPARKRTHMPLSMPCTSARAHMRPRTKQTQNTQITQNKENNENTDRPHRPHRTQKTHKKLTGNTQRKQREQKTRSEQRTQRTLRILKTLGTQQKQRTQENNTRGHKRKQGNLRPEGNTKERTTHRTHITHRTH